MMTGWENENPESFLRILENTSVARQWCREFIRKHAKSVIEIGCGGLNERRALDPLNGIHYTGTDATWKFIENALTKYPEDEWLCVDVTNLVTKILGRYDVVYSQHVLEHCAGIGTPLINMLKVSRKHVLNIFFINPTDGPELVNWHQYPRYHNTYNKDHIEKICEANGFYCEFKEFSNAEYKDTFRDGNDPPIPTKETVLIATRKQQ